MSVPALAFRLALLKVTVGAAAVTVATCTAAPLPTPLVVTTAVSVPVATGLVENVTVREVAVEAVTAPTAPSLKATVLLAGVELKPKPLIVIVFELMGKLAALAVTTGVTVATCTGAPLLPLPLVTTAVKLPAAVGFVEKVTVSDVAVEVVTVPTAPSLKTTVLLPG